MRLWGDGEKLNVMRKLTLVETSVDDNSHNQVSAK
jgi:hypothetical protein